MCVCVWVGPLQGHHPQEGLQRYTAHLGRGGGACVCVCGTAPRTSPTGRPAKVHCSLREGRGGVCVCVWGGTAPRTSPTGRPAKVHCSLREGRGGVCVCVWVGPLQGHHPQEGLQRYTAHLGRGGGACVCVCGTAPRTSPTGRPAKVHCSLREGRGGVCVCVWVGPLQGHHPQEGLQRYTAHFGTVGREGRGGGGGWACVCVWDRSKDITHRKACKGTLLTSARWGGRGVGGGGWVCVCVCGTAPRTSPTGRTAKVHCSVREGGEGGACVSVCAVCVCVCACVCVCVCAILLSCVVCVCVWLAGWLAVRLCTMFSAKILANIFVV